MPRTRRATRACVSAARVCSAAAAWQPGASCSSGTTALCPLVPILQHRHRRRTHTAFPAIRSGLIHHQSPLEALLRDDDVARLGAEAWQVRFRVSSGRGASACGSAQRPAQERQLRLVAHEQAPGALRGSSSSHLRFCHGGRWTTRARDGHTTAAAGSSARAAHRAAFARRLACWAGQELRLCAGPPILGLWWCGAHAQGPGRAWRRRMTSAVMCTSTSTITTPLASRTSGGASGWHSSHSAADEALGFVRQKPLMKRRGLSKFYASKSQ